ncbi:hypothetical protein [Novosphingobium album (ex Liu et al. 2023)]|uniref:Uncharacterized protein n=1 Tax=Novosphingobium album (ex Liu et al. 2023) TaxID=3031130 RepID=A0ABT5WKT6_9SPHN|nr:hypothetical protein [Novosphingobium album (ex Liu et al. 2023)]MDE8650659.1 hypothetical protein [Novosphingobium album (ex Liu et al. 2023)]
MEVAGSERTHLDKAVAACRDAGAPSREIDARIALAVFPALRQLNPVGPGVWRQGDGSHVRALLYTATRRAAATLVPQGCWIETGPRGPIVMGELGEWIGLHPIEAIALCIAALDARLAEISHAD